MYDFYMFKNSPFSQKAKKICLCDLKRSSSTTDFFELQVDTATLIIPSFKLIKARGCKPRFQSDLLRNYLVPGRMYMLCY